MADTPLIHANDDTLRFRSGRTVVARDDARGERLEIHDSSGMMTIAIRLTDAGPVIEARGATLELKATEHIALDAPTVSVRAREELSLTSDGAMRIDAKAPMAIHSDQDVVMTAAVIRLN